MDGWLAYHGAFVGCIAAALYKCGTDPVRLAADRATLTLMCQAITEAFAALRISGTAGLPRNLAMLVGRSPVKGYEPNTQDGFSDTGTFGPGLREPEQMG
jgi:hypothetical protein